MTRRLLFLIFFALTLLPVMAAAGDTPMWPAVSWRLIDQDKYISGADMSDLSWREIREQRELRSTAMQDPKQLSLEALTASDDPDAVFRPFDELLSATASAFFLDPNGEVHSLKGVTGEENIAALPPDEDLIGRYIIGAHAVTDDMDIDGDGVFETVHFCAKHILTHYKSGGNVGSTSVVFFDDPSILPLEIGPVINTAKSRYGGSIQRAHNTYEMRVEFMGEPLGDARVSIIAEGAGWRKTDVTDEDGIFSITPTDDRSIEKDWQRYLYVVSHRDDTTGTVYISTLPSVIYKNRPEWRSKTVGFTFWAIIGCGLCILFIWGHVHRKRRLERRQMTIYDHHAIKG